MSRGEITKLVDTQRHRCSPPGWWRRWRDHIDAGSEWKCHECGAAWSFNDYESGSWWMDLGPQSKPDTHPAPEDVLAVAEHGYDDTLALHLLRHDTGTWWVVDRNDQDYDGPHNTKESAQECLEDLLASDCRPAHRP